MNVSHMTNSNAVVTCRPAQSRRVVHYVADLARALQSFPTRRSSDLVNDKLLAATSARAAEVVAVTGVDRLPVEGAGGVELDAIGVGHPAIGHGLGTGSLSARGADAIGVDGVRHRAAGVACRPAEGG